ncbi:hypothetical protein ACWD7C_33855 [Streptomyces sp. NPDC005134]|uniref:hypothetical protein n=1 Tax=Streptomyces sp. NPDC005098 TaxID=3154560 RepID=UPI0033A326F9
MSWVANVMVSADASDRKNVEALSDWDGSRRQSGTHAITARCSNGTQNSHQT